MHAQATYKHLLTRLVLIALGVLCALLLLEVGLRVRHRITQGIPLTRNPSSLWDSSLGWLGKEHRFEPLSSSPILVIGDSFTEGLGIVRDEMWFAALAAQYPDRGLIAYGGLGYGTLQQLRVLKRYQEQGVTPSLVVLQLCSNDIINNLFELERGSLLQRPPGPRPYLEGDSVHMRFPRKLDWLVLPLISVSRLAYNISTRWDRMIAQLSRTDDAQSVERTISREGFSFEPFRRATHVTKSLLMQFKEQVGATPLVFMLVDDAVPYSTVFRDISRSLGVPLVIPSRTTPLDPSHRLADGTHLTGEGNKLLGRSFLNLGAEMQALSLKSEQ